MALDFVRKSSRLLGEATGDHGIIPRRRSLSMSSDWFEVCGDGLWELVDPYCGVGVVDEGLNSSGFKVFDFMRLRNSISAKT